MKPIPRMSSVATLIGLAERGESGRRWYVHAREQVIEAAALLDVPPWYYADVLAITSPRVSVKRNIRLANHYLVTGEHHRTTMRSVRRALEHYEATGDIRGPKTSEFARALLGMGDAIVLDVWMARAFGIDQSAFTRPAVRARCEQRIRKAAAALGWSPAEVQAAVWTAAVRRAGKRPGEFTIVHRTLFGDVLEQA